MGAAPQGQTCRDARRGEFQAVNERRACRIICGLVLLKQVQSQPRISDLMRGKIGLFSLDTLLDLATTAGLNPVIKLAPRKHRNKESETA